MDDPITLIFRHGWVFLILVTCINGAVWWRKGQAKIAADPTLARGYRGLIRSFLILMNIPWLVMGSGIVFGGLSTIFDYFNPRKGPFVIAFYVTVVAVWIVMSYWLFFRRGAEALIAHPGLLNFRVERPSVVKAYFLLCLAGGIVGFLWVLLGNVRVPVFR